MEHLDIFKGVILPYANFIIFIAAAVYFFRKPLAEMSRKRRDTFEFSLKEATEARRLAEEKNRELTERLARLDQEISSIKSQTAEVAQKESERIVADANAMAKHIGEEARRMADAEVERAKIELRREIVRSVVEAVEKKLNTSFSREAQVQLTQKQIGALQAVKIDA